MNASSDALTIDIADLELEGLQGVTVAQSQ
jgi:hypothetical protein